MFPEAVWNALSTDSRTNNSNTLKLRCRRCFLNFPTLIVVTFLSIKGWNIRAYQRSKRLGAKWKILVSISIDHFLVLQYGPREKCLCSSPSLLSSRYEVTQSLPSTGSLIPRLIIHVWAEQHPSLHVSTAKNRFPAENGITWWEFSSSVALAKPVEFSQIFHDCFLLCNFFSSGNEWPCHSTRFILCN